ncbi:MAG: hypothetical protein HOH14_00125 [Gammaproteobacteria bacterium]|nr:hypothetical protein [Gammaproteobacteria bacterium]
MTLGLDCQIADVLVAGLHAVFHEEAVAHSIVGHVVLNLQVVGAMHRHAAVVGIVDRRVPDVLASASVPDKVPVDRIAGKFQILAHAIELNTLDIHLAGDHPHDVTAKERLFRVG